METKEKFPFPATLVLIAVSGLIYIIIFLSAMAKTGINVDLVSWFGNHRYHTLDGEWWRLFTSLFIHDNRLTLLVNFHALAFFGLYLEPLIGSAKLVMVYILSGLMSAACSICVIENEYIIGAHGAIAGLGAVYIAVMISGSYSVRDWLLAVWVLIIYIVINLTVTNSGNWASLAGGIAGGFITGLAYYPVFAMGDNNAGKYKTAGVLSLFIFLPVVVLLVLLPNKVKMYQERMELFRSTEAIAEMTMRNDQLYSGKLYLSHIKSDCIEGWKKNYEIVEELEHTHLPEPYKYKNKVAGSYCLMQLQKARYKLRSLQDEKYFYDKAIEQCNTELRYMKNQMNN
ncbi:MAG: rhomboid family intramembrane serine protease [Bacteroidota bacterium]